jgi:hypothetical protein
VPAANRNPRKRSKSFMKKWSRLESAPVQDRSCRYRPVARIRQGYVVARFYVET